jgi:hypothetical protein
VQKTDTESTPISSVRIDQPGFIDCNTLAYLCSKPL